MNSDETRTLSDPRLLWVQEQAEGDDLLVADGFDEAILGIAQRCGERFVVYDQAKVIEVLQRDCSEEDALDWYEYNMVGAWVGDATPAYVTLAPQS